VKKTLMERLVYSLMRLMTYFVVAVVGYVIFDIVLNGIGVIRWDFITSYPRKAGAEGGISPAIVGTFLLVTGTLIIALPFSIGCAIYLSEYAWQGGVHENGAACHSDACRGAIDSIRSFRSGAFCDILSFRGVDYCRQHDAGLHGVAHDNRSERRSIEGRPTVHA